MRLKKNHIYKIIGIVILFLGIVLILLKGLLPEYIDDEGFLHENFFLLPIGFLLIFIGITIFAVIKIKRGSKGWKKNS